MTNRHSLPLQVVKGNRFASSRSIASSITFDDNSASECTDDVDPFLEGSFTALNDNQAIMPQRRQSLLEETPHDSRPNMPQRIRKTSTDTPPITEETLRSSLTDAPPARPNRQQSVTTYSEVGSVTSHDFNEEVPPLPPPNTSSNNAAKSQTSSSSRSLRAGDSDSSSVSLEPLPGYLQPAFSTEAIASKMNEITQQAELFKQIVADIVADRKYGMRTFKQCFIGSEAVDRMVQAGLATSRTEAVELGRNWVKYLGLFQHVTNGHVFKDKYLFYKFVDQKKDANCDEASGEDVVRNTRKQRKSYGSRNTSCPWYATSSMRHGETIQEDEPSPW